MKKIMMSGVIAYAVVLLAPELVQAQGTMTYLSDLDQASSGSLAVGSDSWLAVGFNTGTNSSGDTLNSIQLRMADASGTPSGFTAMLYTAFNGQRPVPGSSLGTLDGSLNPTTAGIYTFTLASNLTLRGQYFIVLTAGTTVANGAYEWSYAGANSYNPSGGWLSQGGVWTFSNGSFDSPFTFTAFPSQFAINATPIPEPGVLGLFGFGGLAFLWDRRKAMAG